MDNPQAVLLGLIGIIASIVALIGIIVRFFVSELKSSRQDHKELTYKFVKIAEDISKSHRELVSAIDTNTKATKESAEQSKKGSDNLTKLILKVIKIK